MEDDLSVEEVQARFRALLNASPLDVLLRWGERRNLPLQKFYTIRALEEASEADRQDPEMVRALGDLLEALAQSPRLPIQPLAVFDGGPNRMVTCRLPAEDRLIDDEQFPIVLPDGSPAYYGAEVATIIRRIELLDPVTRRSRPLKEWYHWLKTSEFSPSFYDE